MTAVGESLAPMNHEIGGGDDGSRDVSFEQLKALADFDERVRVLKFSSNFGQQVAITAGSDYARGDCVAVIDSDLQDPPEVMWATSGS